MPYPKCVGIGMQKDIGLKNGLKSQRRCIQTLTFDSNLSEEPYNVLRAISQIQFPYYVIESVKLSPSDPTILETVYIVDSSD